MPLYFNQSERSDCAFLRGFITNNDTFYLDVGVAKVIPNEDKTAFLFIGLINKFEGLINFDNKDWRFEPCHVVFVLHDQKFTRKTKNKETNQYEDKDEIPSIAELAFLQYIEKEIGFGIWFTGELEFSNSKIATEYLSVGEHPKIDRLFDCCKIDTASLSQEIVDFLIGSLTKKSGSKNGSGYTPRTIQSLYDERLEILLKVLAPYSVGCSDPINLAFGLKGLKNDDPEAYSIVFDLLTLLLK